MSCSPHDDHMDTTDEVLSAMRALVGAIFGTVFIVALALGWWLA